MILRVVRGRSTSAANKIVRALMDFRSVGVTTAMRSASYIYLEASRSHS